MKFSEFPYYRPNMAEVKQQFKSLLIQFETAKNSQEQEAVIRAINSFRDEFDSMQGIANIRHTIDTTNREYEEERNYYDENTPIYEELISEYYRSLVNSKYRSSLEQKFGKLLLTQAKMKLKTISPEVIADLQAENKLSTDYIKLIASAKIMFEGQERNLSEIEPFQLSNDRQVRKRANEARWSFFKDNEQQIDEIYDKLVKIRTKIANKLGFKNFIELAYLRLRRSDYNAKDVAVFRRQVEKYIVPLANRLRERQRSRLGLDTLKYYDIDYDFNTGNATPKGNPEWIVDNGRTMYSQLSAETKKFFDFMTKHELMDLVSKKNKAFGGYCDYIPKYKAPFIFSNFNGTEGDVTVLTHEAGHAFQGYMSSWNDVPEYYYPTMEACEIHSMSMEFITWPWMELFFKEDTDKFKFSHLSGAVCFIPYGVAVDEFQHFVYENPEATPTERKAMWRQIEKKYMPYKDYAGNAYLESGGFWQKQAHIFETPFYYIDYTLAQVCAFQFWKKSIENREAAWEDYLRLCKAGGRLSFTELVQLTNLNSPFDDNCLAAVIGTINDWLNLVDDNKL